ncbi:MAG: indole-3-glycerol phosphate synthase TrpC [Halarsenatibacteraceae bacterium]
MILDKIIAEKKKEVAELTESRKSLKARLSQSGISLIAEIKKASPSKGIIQENFQPKSQAITYQKAGASAISVLTDQKFFQGSNQILQEVRQVTDLPILRKEFIIDPIQIYQSFFIGADVILLIVAVLDLEQLQQYLALASELNLEAIVEVHNQKELEKALKAEAEIIGINNRDLTTFDVDLKTTETIVNILESRNQRNDYYLIAESGIKTKADIDYLKEIGVDGVLIGETLMRADSPENMIADLGLKRGGSHAPAN